MLMFRLQRLQRSPAPPSGKQGGEETKERNPPTEQGSHLSGARRDASRAAHEKRKNAGDAPFQERNRRKGVFSCLKPRDAARRDVRVRVGVRDALVCKWNILTVFCLVKAEAMN